MAKAKKLPPGNWNIRVYDYTDQNGKKVYQSFTAPTKAEVQAQAAVYSSNKHRIQRNDFTIREAVDKYIHVKEGTLSESTIAGYVKDSRQIAPIENLYINRVTSEELQQFVSQFNKATPLKLSKT